MRLEYHSISSSMAQVEGKKLPYKLLTISVTDNTSFRGKTLATRSRLLSF